MLYVALGDSITAGESATSPGLAYPSLVVKQLQTLRSSTPHHDGVANAVLAEPGWTSQDLYGALLAQSPAVLRAARVVTIWVGGDNLVQAGLTMVNGGSKTMLALGLASYTAALGRLVRYVQGVSHARIILCTQYNPFPHSPIAQQGIGALNEAIAGTASATNVAIAPVHQEFEGHESKWIYGYRTGRLEDVVRSPVPPVHPNNAGHRAIANLLVPLVQ